jgi:hypothetical protein
MPQRPRGRGSHHRPDERGRDKRPAQHQRRRVLRPAGARLPGARPRPDLRLLGRHRRRHPDLGPAEEPGRVDHGEHLRQHGARPRPEDRRPVAEGRQAEPRGRHLQAHDPERAGDRLRRAARVVDAERDVRQDLPVAPEDDRQPALHLQALWTRAGVGRAGVRRLHGRRVCRPLGDHGRRAGARARAHHRGIV